MALQYMDNFSFYGTDVNNLLLSSWAALSSGSLANDPDGVSGGKVLRTAVSPTGAFATRVVIRTPDEAMGVAFRTWVNSLPSSNGVGAAVSFKTEGNSHIITLHITPTGQLRLVNTVGEGTGLDALTTSSIGKEVATTGPLVIGAAQWKHIEFFYDNADGAYEVRVEGVEVLSGIDPDFSGTTLGNIEFLDQFNSGAGGAPANYIKDLVIWDTTGSQNNTFIGSVFVVALPVNSDVSSGWTPSTGSSDFALLDELDPNDADYIEAADTLPAASIMGFENLPADVVGVRGLMTMVRALKTDGGDANLQVGLISGGNTDVGADTPVGASAGYVWDISEIDPNTAALWSPSAVDLATIQIDRTL